MKRILLTGAAAAALAAPLAFAEPADYVNTPNVAYGEREIDFKFGTQKPSGEDRTGASSLGFGYGVSQTWFTEIYAKYKKEDGPTRFDAFEWENKFQLTETGKFPVDLGFLVELEHPQARSEGWEVKFGPLFQTEFDRTQLNANFFFTRNYRAAFSNPLRMSYQWQVRQRLDLPFDLGVQGFGELGKWDNWAPRTEQAHRLGPAVFGRINLGDRKAIQYNAAWLVDAHDTPHNNTFRLQAEYEF